MTTALVELRNLVKVFPPSVVALDGANLKIESGKVHSIIGENGAGKTTLMRAFYGLISCERGEMYYRGDAVSFSSPSEAVRAGIGMVHQEFMLIPSYRVIENIIIGAEPCKFHWTIDWKRARAHTMALMEKYGISVDLDAQVKTLSVAAQQKIEILKLLCRDVDVLILDEPTAVLTPQETEQLFRRIRALQSEGKTIIFISHKLDEVRDISDTITVMRKGRDVATIPNKDVTRKTLASLMVGREVIFSVEVPPAVPGEIVMEMEKVKSEPAGDGAGIDIDLLQVRRGEIVGIAGLEGHGQLALTEVITGLRRPIGGAIRILGEDVGAEGTITRRKHLSYVPQDRRYMGTCQSATLTHNAIMTHHRTNPLLAAMRGIFLSSTRCRELSQQIIDDFNVKISDLNQQIMHLSGGNQQKVVVGREFHLDHPFVLLDQPTRGLDVGSIEYIQKRIVEIRMAGCGCLLLSADLDELQTLSDRIVVLYQGRIVAEFGREEADRITIGHYMLGAQ